MLVALYSGDTKVGQTVTLSNGHKEGKITRLTAKTATVEVRYGGMDPRVVKYTYRLVAGSWVRGRDTLHHDSSERSI